MRHTADEDAGAVHHVVAQGNGRLPIVVDDRDRGELWRRLEGIADACGWVVHTSGLMDTHHHAILETSVPNLGRGMQRVLGGYAYVFNKRHDREGHLFHGPYWSRRVHGDGHFLAACLYAVLNPVAPVVSPSGRMALVQLPPDPHRSPERRLMGLLGRSPAEAIGRYREVVDGATALLLEQRRIDARGLLQIARGRADRTAGLWLEPEPLGF